VQRPALGSYTTSWDANVRRLGVSLPMRKAASWFGSSNPPNTRLRHDHFVRHTRAPLQSSSRHAQVWRRARSRQGL